MVIDKGPEGGAFLQIKLGKGQKINLKNQQKKPLPSWVFLWGASGRAGEIESVFQRQDFLGSSIHTLAPPEAAGLRVYNTTAALGKREGDQDRFKRHKAHRSY